MAVVALVASATFALTRGGDVPDAVATGEPVPIEAREAIPPDPKPVEVPDGVYDAGHGVTVVTDDLDGTVTAVPADPIVGLDGLDGLEAATDTFRVVVEGSFDGTAEVWLPLLNTVGEDTILIGLHAPDLSTEPELVPARVEDEMLVLTTTSFSLFGGLRTSADAVIDTLRRDVFDPLLSDLSASAQHPTCDGEDAARGDGYTISSDDGPTVFWCFGTDGEQRELKVTNNRRYALRLLTSNLDVAERPTSATGLGRFASMLAAGGIALAPRETVTFRADLPPGGTASVTTEWDGVAGALHQLETGVVAAAAVYGWLKLGGFDVDTFLAGLVDTAICADLLLSAGNIRAGDLLAQCITLEMAASYGWRGAIAGAVLTAAPVVAFFTTQTQLARDALSSDVAVNYRIELTRASQPAGGHASPGCAAAPRTQEAEHVTRCLYEAWFAGDRATAEELVYPETGVLERLFSFQPGEPWEFEGCTGFECTFYEPWPGEVHGVTIILKTALDIDGDGGLYVGGLEIYG
jgi:hypothetical protein